MKQIYRGYPQALVEWMEPDRYGLVEAQNAMPQFDRTYDWNQWNYFRGLYPMEAKRLQRVAEEEFDRIDRDGGSLYDEYPDREFLYRVRDLMLAKALAEGMAADRDLMQVVMLHELLRRRIERRQWNANRQE